MSLQMYAVRGHHEAPFIASPLPDAVPGDSMVSVLLSDYFVNSVGFAYQDADQLAGYVTDKVIPKEVPVRLNTKTFEEIFPPLYAKYPDRMMTVEWRVWKTAAKLLEGKLVEAVDVDVGFNIGEVTPTPPHRLRALTVKMNIVAEAQLRAEGAAIKGSVALVSFGMQLKDSTIGPLDVEPAKPLFEMVAKQMVIPKVNARLEKGFVLPAFGGISLRVSSLAVKPGYIVVSADGCSGAKERGDGAAAVRL